MARQIYKTQDGKRLPSVTTILGRFRESGGLIRWANKEGLAGRNSDHSRDEAAITGNLAHRMIELHIRGEDPLSIADEVNDADKHKLGEASHAFDQFIAWLNQAGITLTESELKLIKDQEEMGYGGTIDAIGIRNGALVLLDWKTSRSLHVDVLLQVAAYGMLLKRARDINVSEYHVVRFSKTEHVWEHRVFEHGQLDPARLMFLSLVDAYYYDAQVNKIFESQ